MCLCFNFRPTLWGYLLQQFMRATREAADLAASSCAKKLVFSLLYVWVYGVLTCLPSMHQCMTLLCSFVVYFFCLPWISELAVSTVFRSLSSELTSWLSSHQIEGNTDSNIIWVLLILNFLCCSTFIFSRLALKIGLYFTFFLTKACLLSLCVDRIQKLQPA